MPQPKATASPEPLPDPIEILEDREEQLRQLLEGLLPGEPYIFQGRYSWFCLEDEQDPRVISILYMELGLAFQVHPEGIFPPDKTLNTTPSATQITSNSRDQEAADFLRAVCQEDGIGLVEIYWNAEISRSGVERCFRQLKIALP